jgi:hypothetical protein
LAILLKRKRKAEQGRPTKRTIINPKSLMTFPRASNNIFLHPAMNPESLSGIDGVV